MAAHYQLQREEPQMVIAYQQLQIVCHPLVVINGQMIKRQVLWVLKIMATLAS